MASKTCSTCLLLDRGLCGAGSAAGRAALAAMAAPLDAEAGALLAEQELPVTHFIVLRHGSAKLSRTMADGREQIVGFALAGNIIGLSGSVHAASAEVVDAVRACRFPRAAFDRLLAAEPGLARHVIDTACDELTKAQERMLWLGRKTAIERTASFVLDLCDRHGVAEGPIPSSISRTDMAAHLGLTLETISRSMTKLRQMGAVGTGAYRQIVIRDRPTLVEMAA